MNDGQKVFGAVCILSDDTVHRVIRVVAVEPVKNRAGFAGGFLDRDDVHLIPLHAEVFFDGISILYPYFENTVAGIVEVKTQIPGISGQPFLRLGAGETDQVGDQLLLNQGLALLYDGTRPVLLIHGTKDEGKLFTKIWIGDRLLNIIDDSDADGFFCIVKFVKCTDQNHPDIWLDLDQPGAKFNSADTGHFDIGDHKVDVVRLGIFDCGIPVVEGSFYLSVKAWPVNLGQDALDCKMVVIYDDYIPAHSEYSSIWSIVIVTIVPSPGAESIFSVPFP